MGSRLNGRAGARRLSVLPVISCVGQKAGLTLSQLFHLHLLEGESARTVGPAVFIAGAESRKAGHRPDLSPVLNTVNQKPWVVVIDYSVG